MDDIKIIFYLVVTLLWFFFNNYRKIQKQARERRNNQPEPENTPDSETPEFDWEEIFGKGRQSTETPEPEPKTRHEAPSRQPVRNSRTRQFTAPVQNVVDKTLPSGDGLNFASSQRRDVKRSLKKRFSHSSRSEKIRRTNWKKAVILSEVLHPPYV